MFLALMILSVEREIDENEQLWVIKIIPAPGSTNKSKHFALPSEKDLHMWARRFLKELHLANDEAYARSINSDMAQLTLHKSQSDYYMYDDVSQYTSCTDLDEDMRQLSSSACLTNTQQLPALYALTKTAPQKDCFFSSSNVYEDYQSLVALSGAVSGWLRRRESSILKTWTKTFTVLYRGHVYTYKNETCGKQTDHFSLYGYISVERDLDIEDKEQLWVIKIIPAVGSPNKPIYFALPSEKDLH
ncbi:Hypothetical predicted protein, partial [Mytilus galloprovincialis]